MNKEKAPVLGAHTSISGGLHNALLEGQKIGCETIQVFTKSSNRWQAKEITEKEQEQFNVVRTESGIAPVVAHDSYLINLASPDPTNHRRSMDAFLIEIRRAELLEIPYLVTHPGSHRGAGEEEGLKRFSESLRTLLEETQGAKSMVLIETTAGQGAYLGYRFEHIAEILERVGEEERMGACFDTCHTFAAGYDLRDPDAYHSTLDEFDRIVGVDRIKVFHLNDSMRDLGSKVDRHKHIGEGAIGLKAFELLLKDSRFRGLPMILETPGEPEDRGEDLKVLRRLCKNA